MVEASTELLVGAAVTVFLALLFFGVVVLWDVALALRSVGDKIDKLEDNIDDDLTDIGHSLDGISNAPGGGSGTQLHLNGGTISSGPGANQAQQPHQPQQTPGAGHQQGTGPQGSPGPQQAAAGQTEQPGDVGPEPHHQRSRTARRESAVQEGPTAGENLEDPDPTESDHAAEDPAAASDEPPQSDDGEIDESDAERSDEDSEPDEETASEESHHPRAEINRGRFVTSPDRTAWYATPLDREAIEAARPTIAGALPDGSDSGVDESEIIAAGPVDSSESVATDDGEDADGATAMPASSTDSTDRSTDDDETPADDGDEETTAADNGDEERAADEDGSDAGDETSADEPASDEDAPDTDASDAGDGVGAAESDAGDAADDGDESTDETDDAEDGAETEAGLEEAAADDVPDSPDDVDVLSFEEGTDDDDAESDDDRTDVPDLADEPGETEFPAAEAESTSESGTADDSAAGTEPESERETEDEGERPAADSLTGFEFDEGEFEADDEDVTVEEAVDTMNEDAPAPELSSHRFDVTAENRDDGSAVLTFEFDTETVDISGSTERLLQYQMRSFADRESTPDGDVTIGRDRIVIEIPESDGAAIQQWGEAAVSIIDRTLYLSDNSDGS